MRRALGHREAEGQRAGIFGGGGVVHRACSPGRTLVVSRSVEMNS
jgi:hypothetical protein